MAVGGEQEFTDRLLAEGIYRLATFGRVDIADKLPSSDQRAARHGDHRLR
jgi:hypothetical protein